MATPEKPLTAKKVNPRPYEWDFDGACAPGRGGHYSSQQTFTLGIFQWLPKWGGRGLKKGRVVHRVRGLVASPEDAYERAREIVGKMNAEASNGS